MSIDSVRLFVERAQAVDPTFVLTLEDAPAVARLCHHLDGLPLAIELAASRVAVLPVAAIADRLDDRFHLLVGGSRTALSRQQTLKATLDWSYNLLTEPERRMLRLLSVFVGGAPLDAIEAIAVETWGSAGDAVALLGELVDQSLVTLDDATAMPRYRVLETVREYGRDRLVEHGERAPIESAHTHLGPGHRRGRSCRPVGAGLADDVRSARDRARQPAGRAGSEPVGGSRPGARSGRPPLGVLAVERLPGRGPAVAEPCPGAIDGADAGPREGAGRARGPRHPVRGHRARRPPGRTRPS